MERGLKHRLKQNAPFESAAQEALLNLFVAASHMRDRIDRVCETHGISYNQYNILRILNGGPCEGYARCDLIERMLDRSPDVTRLSDRLVKEGLVQRHRSREDRRVTLHAITEQGQTLLQRMRSDIEGVITDFAVRIEEKDQQHLSRICEDIYLE
jgi:DNA-binding MarR family transcriptional regulator